MTTRNFGDKLNLVKRLITVNRSSNLKFLLRGASCFLKTNLLRRPICKYLDISIGSECNMHCKHCFAASFKSDSRPRLDFEEYKSLAKDAYTFGILHVNLQGGEPLVIENLEKYIKVFTNTGIYTSITTNGYELSEDWIHRLKDCGVRKITVSLDSMLPGEHDAFRGKKGAHERAVQGIELSRKHGLSVSVNVTVSKTSMQSEGQKQLFDWLHAEKIPATPNLACAVGAWGSIKELLVGDEEIRQLDEMKNKYQLVIRDIHMPWLKTGCSAVSEQFYITPYGDVTPCPFIQVSLGNLRNERLGDIWRKAMREGLNGRYHARCWAAEEKAFVHDLQDVYGNYDGVKGRAFLAKYWHD